MPDITYPNTFTTGTAPDPFAVAQNLTEPRSTPATLNVINGLLDQTNMSVDVQREMVRRGQYRVGGTVGSTINKDFFKGLMPGSWDIDLIAEAAKHSFAIPGAAQTKHIPFDCSAFYVSWHIGVIVDGDRVDPILPAIYSTVATGKTTLYLAINGLRMPSSDCKVLSSENTLFHFEPGETPAISCILPDHRWIHDHFVVDANNEATLGFTTANTPLLSGLHTAEVRVAQKASHVRFKTCRLTIMGIR